MICEPKIQKTSIFHKLFFPKYNNFKIISAVDICLSWVKWIRLVDKIQWDFLACFKLRRYALSWKIIKTCMYRFCESKYSFQLRFLWRKLEFYTKVHKKMCIFCCSLNHKTPDTYLWSHHNRTHTSCTT